MYRHILLQYIHTFSAKSIYCRFFLNQEGGPKHWIKPQIADAAVNIDQLTKTDLKNSTPTKEFSSKKQDDQSPNQNFTHVPLLSNNKYHDHLYYDSYMPYN